MDQTSEEILQFLVKFFYLHLDKESFVLLLQNYSDHILAEVCSFEIAKLCFENPGQLLSCCY